MNINGLEVDKTMLIYRDYQRFIIIINISGKPYYSKPFNQRKTAFKECDILNRFKAYKATVFDTKDFKIAERWVDKKKGIYDKRTNE